MFWGMARHDTTIQKQKTMLESGTGLSFRYRVIGTPDRLSAFWLTKMPTVAAKPAKTAMAEKTAGKPLG